jgi:hypothetical protein
VHLFVRSAGVWASQWQHAVPTLSGSSSTTVSLRPSSVPFIEDDLFVGNPNASLSPALQGAGNVVRFTGSANRPGFVPFGTLQDPDPTANAHFGSSLSGSGSLLLVGAPAAVASEARARVFKRQSLVRSVP